MYLIRSSAIFYRAGQALHSITLPPALMIRVLSIFTAAFVCNRNVPWLDLLTAVFLGLPTALEEDLLASPTEILLETTFRDPGEFFSL